MKVPEIFNFDKRVINRLISTDPSHRQKVKEYRDKIKDTSENIEILNFKEILPQKKSNTANK